MYKLIRNTHLLLGLFTVLFVLMYAVSAVQMAHRIRIPQQVSEVDLPLAAGLEPRALAQILMERYGYDGELGGTQNTPRGYRFAITRAGGNYNVTYDRASGGARVRIATTGFLGVLNRLHHFHGLHNQSGARNAWGWALAFVSVTLLVLGGTGIYMWFRLYKERLIGSILLGSSLVVSIGLLVVLRW